MTRRRSRRHRRTTTTPDVRRRTNGGAFFEVATPRGSCRRFDFCTSSFQDLRWRRRQGLSSPTSVAGRRYVRETARSDARPRQLAMPELLHAAQQNVSILHTLLLDMLKTAELRVLLNPPSTRHAPSTSSTCSPKGSDTYSAPTPGDGYIDVHVKAGITKPTDDPAVRK